jgi:hypothetical protein
MPDQVRHARRPPPSRQDGTRRSSRRAGIVTPDLIRGPSSSPRLPRKRQGGCRIKPGMTRWEDPAPVTPARPGVHLPWRRRAGKWMPDQVRHDEAGGPRSRHPGLDPGRTFLGGAGTGEGGCRIKPGVARRPPPSRQDGTRRSSRRAGIVTPDLIRGPPSSRRLPRKRQGGCRIKPGMTSREARGPVTPGWTRGPPSLAAPGGEVDAGSSPA